MLLSSSSEEMSSLPDLLLLALLVGDAALVVLKDSKPFSKLKRQWEERSTIFRNCIINHLLFSGFIIRSLVRFI